MALSLRKSSLKENRLMKCQRCLENEVSHRVFSDIINSHVCTSCANKALNLGLTVEVLPKSLSNRQPADTLLSRPIPSRKLYSHSAEMISSMETSVLDEQVTCSWCGHKEILKKQRALGRRHGSNSYIIHHECKSGHRFHNSYSTDPSSPLRLLQCDC